MFQCFGEVTTTAVFILLDTSAMSTSDADLGKKKGVVSSSRMGLNICLSSFKNFYLFGDYIIGEKHTSLVFYNQQLDTLKLLEDVGDTQKAADGAWAL